MHHPVLSPAATQHDRQFALTTGMDSRYHTFALLMPFEFRLMSSIVFPQIQQLVDQAITRIVNTPTGHKMCSQTTGGEAQRIKDYFGVSTKTAEALSKTCTPKTPVKLPVKHERTREYILIQTSDENHPVEGWTTPHNVTYVFLSPKDFNEKFLLRVLTHEVATKLDMKEQWGWIGPLDVFSKHVGVRYTGEQECAVQAAVRHPLIKYALSALRAEQIENQVLFELGLGPAPTLSPSQSCESEVLEKMPSILRIGSILQMENNYQLIIGAQCGLTSQLNVFELLQTITRETVTELETGEQKSVCDFLRTPKLSSFIFSPFMGGPRPRVGPWAEKASELKDDPSLRNAATARRFDQILRGSDRGQSTVDRDLKDLFEKRSQRKSESNGLELKSRSNSRERIRLDADSKEN